MLDSDYKYAKKEGLPIKEGLKLVDGFIIDWQVLPFLYTF
ncbi:hypothetical protein SAMN05421761_108150 [Belliella pelovolcani]|uniref:Uncharacterized protein n=1 Tax=Belliella pelovolcani TaxID=529505 RepID=A0A1N7N4G1_9BACT|nr:hypothetical protein SAMN05421761_108150 [Belliella pelovolcani]